VLYSVGQPFKGDYVEITKNPKYQKLNSLAEDRVLLADVVSKINRANGKVSTSIPVPIKINLITGLINQMYDLSFIFQSNLLYCLWHTDPFFAKFQSLW